MARAVLRLSVKNDGSSDSIGTSGLISSRATGFVSKSVVYVRRTDADLVSKERLSNLVSSATLFS